MKGIEIIRARTKDDAAILIGRMIKSESGEIVLVLPKNSILIADLNSLKILKSEAESVDKILYISSENEKIKSFAEKIQLPIYGAAAPAGVKKEKPVKIKVMMDIAPPSVSAVPAQRTGDFENESADEENNGQEKDWESDETPNTDSDYGPDDSNEFGGDGDRFSEGSGNDSGEDLPSEGNKEPAPEITLAKSDNLKLERDIESFYKEPQEKSKIRSVKEKPKFKISQRRILTALVGGGLAFFLAALYLILPKADVKISLKKLPLDLQIQTAVSKNISSPNLASGILPGQYFLLTKSGTKAIETGSAVPQSGAAPSAPQKAGGSITIYNAYGAAPQKLIAQTRFETKDGKIYRLQRAVVVPGAKMSGSKLTPSAIEASVVSDGTGDNYAIGPSYFTIPGFKGSPKYAGFYAESSAKMTLLPAAAQSSTETPPGKTQAIEKTKQDLENELAGSLKNDTLNTFKDSDFKLIDGASSITVKSFKADANSVSMSITWQAIFFNEKDFRSLIDYAIVKKYPVLQNFDFKDNIAYPEAAKADFKKGEIYFTYELKKDNALNPDLAGLKKNLAGLDENGMRDVVSGTNFVDSATISLWPFWVRRSPKNPDKINITLDSQ